MTGRLRPGRRFALAAALAAMGSVQALALPTMIRLGYPNCVSCHYAPQGGGLLNQYGRGIDEAQSRRAGEYKPTENLLVRTLSWDGRITQDFRVVAQEQLSGATGQPVIGKLRTRFMYRNVTELGRGFRFSGTAYGENESVPRPFKSYEPPVTPGNVYLASAMVQYRRGDRFEIAAGRDQLPYGIFVSDQTSFVRSRNRQGYYDTPTQVKMFVWDKRYQVSPFFFAPSGEEKSGFGERGGGTLAEFDLLGNHKTIVGVSLLRGSSQKADRGLAGVYTRLGFGRWGIFAEHDVTDRTLREASRATFRQHASYAQVFWAAREWFVISLVGERLTVEAPFREKLAAGKVEVAARLTSQVSLGASTRVQRNALTGQWGLSAALQLAMKTPN